MRTSHINIQRQVNDVKKKMSDKEFFTSDAFAGYLADIAETVSKRYKRPLKVQISYDEGEDSGIACTNNNVIAINTANCITRSFPNRVLRTESIIGILSHEIGHVNFTDFALGNVFYRELDMGNFYPEEPKDLSMSEQQALNEFYDFYKAKDKVATDIITYIAHSIMNITEDAYVEAKMCAEFPGRLKKAIYLTRIRSNETTFSIKEQIKKKVEPALIMLNLICSYATSSEINNLGGYKGEYLIKLNECIPIIDDCIYDDNSKSRMRATALIMLKIWKYIKEAIDKEKSKPKNSKSTMVEKMKSGSPTKSAEPIGSSSPVKGDARFGEPAKRDKELEEKIKKVIEEEKERPQKNEGGEIEAEGSGIVKKENSYAGSGYAECGRDIDRILNKAASCKVNEEFEKKLIKGIRDEVKAIKYGDIHKNCNITIKRINPVPQKLINEYKRVSPKLLLLSKHLQKGVMRILKERKNGGKYTGLFMGKKMEARSFVREDGKYFYKNTLPSSKLDLAVSVLVDESGSMSSQDRITVARASSIVIYDFCTKLEIPVTVTGHTTGGGVQLYSYAEFNSVDGNDCYRMMDMSARNCNRDGAALKYVAEKLSKRTEKVKLLIIISDGQPSDNGYYGVAAEEDLQSIKKEYTRKGITIFAAAIGSDKEDIKRIYKDGFLDITDITKLPVNLVNLIAKHIK